MDAAKRRVARTCRLEVIADAPIESVWRVIADVTRTGEWSHECHHVAWLDGATAAAPGVRFRGRSRSGWLRWSRRCEVLAVDAPQQIAWRTIPTPLFVDSTHWRISLEPAGTGTRIVQTFQVTRCPRWFASVLGGALLVLLSGGQIGRHASSATAAGPVKIGALTEAWGPNPQMVGLRDGLRELGYRDDVDFVIGVRFTQGNVDALAPAARELVEQGVDILFAGGGMPAQAAQAVTSRIPIVFAGSGDDPVERGLVKSINRPGGNITGVIDLGNAALYKVRVRHAGISSVHPTRTRPNYVASGTKRASAA